MLRRIRPLTGALDDRAPKRIGRDRSCAVRSLPASIANIGRT
jgi:hypothetical protein